MKLHLMTLVLVLLVCFPAGAEQLPPGASAVWSETALRNANHPNMTLSTDVVRPGSYVIVDQSGSITRSTCPYSCKDRGLPENHCRSWPSVSNPGECYVQDTRIRSDAIADTAQSRGRMQEQKSKNK